MIHLSVGFTWNDVCYDRRVRGWKHYHGIDNDWLHRCLEWWLWARGVCFMALVLGWSYILMTRFKKQLDQCILSSLIVLWFPTKDLIASVQRTKWLDKQAEVVVSWWFTLSLKMYKSAVFYCHSFHEKQNKI